MRRRGLAGGRKQHFAARCGQASIATGSTSIRQFPYDHFTNVTDADEPGALRLPDDTAAGSCARRENELSFPLDQRFVIAGWKLLFLRQGNLPAGLDAERGMESRRLSGRRAGALRLVPHPRNALGAERASAQFAGGDVDNWHAYAINAQSPAPVPWDADALFAYLRDGWHPDHGVARGPMAEVVSNLSSVPQDDIRAIATYMAACSARRRRIANVRPRRCWQRSNHPR